MHEYGTLFGLHASTRRRTSLQPNASLRNDAGRDTGSLIIPPDPPADIR